jgi:outer membrane protein assembly factor BamB
MSQTDGSIGSGDWPLIQFDSGRTGNVPGRRGPTRDVGYKWDLLEVSVVTDTGITAEAGTLYVNGDRLYAVDSATGEIAWSVGDSSDSQMTAPLVRDGVVYSGRGSELLRAHDAGTGERLWAVTTDVDHGTHALGYYDGTVYVSRIGRTSEDAKGGVSAIDADTQSLVWEYDAPGWTSPVAADSERVYFNVNYDETYAVDRDSGRRAWQQSYDLRGNVAAPAVDGDALVVPTNWGVAVLDPATGRERWRSSVGMVRGSPAVTPDRVIAGTEDGRLVAINRRSRETDWHLQTGNDYLHTPPVVVDGVVYVGASDNAVYAVDAQTGDRLWRRKIKDTGYGIYSSPVVLDEVVYVASNGTDGVYAFEEGGTGKPTAAFTVSDPPERRIEGDELTFDAAESEDPDGSIESYEWTITSDRSYDDTNVTKTGEVVSHTFEEAMGYTVSLKVVDDAGISAQTRETIDVRGLPLSLDVTHPRLRPPDVTEAVPGRSAPLEVEVRNTAGFSLPAALEFDVAGPLSVERVDPAGGSWDRERQRLRWDELPANAVKQIAVRVTVPSDVDLGEYDVTMALLETESGASVTKYHTLRVDDPQSLDSEIRGEDGEVDGAEVMTAIESWQDDRPIPGTDGERVSDQYLMELIRTYFDGR